MSQPGPSPRQEKTEHDMSDMETDGGGDKRSLDELLQQDPAIPSKGAHPRKMHRVNEDEEVTNTTILAAIQMLATRFDYQEKKLEELNVQIKQNSEVISNLIQASEFNAKETKGCKDKVSLLEKEVECLRTDYNALQEKSKEQDRYKRRWNL